MNGKKRAQILEVHTTSDFTYNGEIHNIAGDFITPKKCLSFVSNHVKGNRRINNKIYDINTNSYKNLITNITRYKIKRGESTISDETVYNQFLAQT